MISVALEDFQKLLGAIIEAGNRKGQLARQQQEAQSLQEYRQQEMQFRQQELQQKQKEWEANQAIVGALKKAQTMQDMGNLSKSYSEFGNLPVGSQIQSSRVDPNTGYTYHTLKFNNLQDEQGNPLTTEVMSPKSYGEFRGKQVLAEQAPIKDLISQNQATNQAAIERLRAEDAASRLKDINDLKLQIAQMTDKRSRDEASDRLQNSIALALLREQGKNKALENFDPTFYAQQVREGRMTDTEVRKLGKDQSAAVFNELSRPTTQGAKPSLALNDNQKKFLEGVGPALDSVKAMDNFNDLMDNNPIAARTWLTQEHQDAIMYQDQARRGIASASTGVFAQSARAMQQALKADQNAYTPSMGLNVSGTNRKKRDTLVNDINHAIDDKLGDFSTEQRQLFKDTYGLTPYLQSVQSQAQGGKHLYFDPQGNPVQGQGVQ